ncbi:hypothetical protein HA466_0116120 [Hirschfeldia incana]|nr:hypothetical protein HA466_0116120 [Hirschfeldia incana]
MAAELVVIRVNSERSRSTPPEEKPDMHIDGAKNRFTTEGKGDSPEPKAGSSVKENASYQKPKPADHRDTDEPLEEKTQTGSRFARKAGLRFLSSFLSPLNHT